MVRVQVLVGSKPRSPLQLVNPNITAYLMLCSIVEQTVDCELYLSPHPRKSLLFVLGDNKPDLPINYAQALPLQVGDK